MPLINHRFQARSRQQTALIVLTGILILAACMTPPVPEVTPTVEDHTLSPTASVTASATQVISLTASATTTIDPNIPWQNFPGPVIDPVIPIPPPAARLFVPDEVQIGILLGTNRPAPFVGRTDAMMLMFYNPTLGRASLVSLPADLFVYIPGYTMQRLQIAYAVGGIEQVFSAVEYNFGIRPEHWALIHPAELTTLVDDLNGLHIDIPIDYPDVCGGLKAERKQMKGEEVMCYITFRQDMDELDRNRRQLDVVAQIFRRMVQSGNLVRLPGLVQTVEPNVETSYTLETLVDFIPLALQLGDPKQLGFYYFEPNQILLWDIPGQSDGQAFQPAAGALSEIVQTSLDFVLFAQPHDSIVKTLEYELTISPTPTITPTFTPTPTRTPIPTRTARPTATRFTFTPSATRTTAVSPTNTMTPTETLTPTESLTPTETAVETSG
jgi:polyisoprenyl-teichoic acid--peptidoglycan teichoic acid transferase